ncbi:hypothetical protein FRB90_007395, partial [Tulasnella sp. 427]
KPHIGRKIVISEARKWHRRIYGGVEFPGRILPHELGVAAGYEAYRQWSMYGQVYRPVLRGEKEREKEALAGIAVGEATKLASTITPGQRRGFLAEASAIAIGVAWKMRKEGKEEEEEFEEAEEEAIGRRGGRPRLRKRRSSFTYGEAISSESDEDRFEGINQGRYPVMAGGAGLGIRSPVIGGGTSLTPFATQAILPQATGITPTQTGSAMYAQPSVASTAGAIPAGHRRVQYMTSSGQPIQYVTSTGQPIVYVTPSGAGQQQAQYAQQPVQYGQQPAQYAQQPAQYAQQQPQYAQQQQPQVMVVPQGNLGTYAPGAGLGGGVAGYGGQPQYAVAGQQPGLMAGQQPGLMAGQQPGLVPGQQQLMPMAQQYTGVGAGYPAAGYGTGGQMYTRPRAYSVGNPAGGYTQQVF